MWIVILAPQVVVLAAFVRVCRSEPISEFCSILFTNIFKRCFVFRLNNERRMFESPTEPAEENIGSPTRTTSPTSPGDPPRSEHVCLLPLSVHIPEASSQDDSEDLLPSPFPSMGTPMSQKI